MIQIYVNVATSRETAYSGSFTPNAYRLPDPITVDYLNAKRDVEIFLPKHGRRRTENAYGR
jgi:hypothetical protein